MERMIDVVETTIPKGRTLRIQDGKHLELRVVTGSLWVTHEDDPRDVVLSATKRHRVDRDGATLVHAFDAARLQIASPAGTVPSITLGGGYRDVGSSVLAAMAAAWARGLRDRFATAVAQRERNRLAPQWPA
jgi:hypothetical protein